MADNKNPASSFSLNVSGIRAASSGASLPLVAGFYRIEVVEMYEAADKPDAVLFKVKVRDNLMFEGTQRTIRIMKPRDADHKVRYYWRAALESVGFAPADLDAGVIEIGPASFEGKQAYMFYEPGDKNTAKWEKANFVTEAEFTAKAERYEEERKKALLAAPAAGSSTLALPAPSGGSNLGSVLTGPAPTPPLVNNTINGVDLASALGG